MDPSQRTKCVVCSRELPEGVRFCVRCGANNFDADAGRLAAAQADMDVHQRKSRHERFVYWWRYLTSGLRR